MGPFLCHSFAGLRRAALCALALPSAVLCCVVLQRALRCCACCAGYSTVTSSLLALGKTSQGSLNLAEETFLKALISAPSPLLNLLESLQFEAVVLADAFALICPTEHATKSFLWAGSCPQWWKSHIPSGNEKLSRDIILHLLPRWDSISNYVRSEG